MSVCVSVCHALFTPRFFGPKGYCRRLHLSVRAPRNYVNILVYRTHLCDYFHCLTELCDWIIFTALPFGPKGYCRQLRQNVCPSVRRSVTPRCNVISQKPLPGLQPNSYRICMQQVFKPDSILGDLDYIFKVIWTCWT